jgi:hypothetical protein
MSRFNHWLKLREEVSWPDALRIFGYKPGDFVDPQDYKSRWRKLIMTHHPDRGGDHVDMVNASLANDALKHFVGKQIPGATTATAHEPKPPVSPTANWHDTSLHATDQRTFGKWLHGGIVELLNLLDSNLSARNSDKLTSAIYKVGDIIGQMHRAFAEWKLKTGENTLLSSDDFYHLLELLDADDEKAMRKALRDFKTYLSRAFYDKYVKDFPSMM